jgi:hypothetical protein
MWELEVTNDFEEWFAGLSVAEQEDVIAVVDLLGQKGPSLPFPYSSDVKSSRHGHLRELRIQHRGEPYRVLYAFDPRRIGILLIGGCKAGNDRWYDEYVPRADTLYDVYLKELHDEGLI